MENKKHLLLLNESKPESIEALKKINNIHVSIITTLESKISELPGNFDVYRVNNIYSYDEMLKQALIINKSFRISHIASSEELLIPYAGFLNTYFGLNGSDYKKSLTFTNKIAMKRKLSEKNVPLARFKEINNLATLPIEVDDSEFPIVIKPSIGAGSMNTYKVNDKKHFFELLKTGVLDSLKEINIPLIVEECINMINEYHCEAIIKDRDILFLSLGRYFEPSLILKEKAVSGSVNVKYDEYVKEIKDLLTKVINALEIDSGVVHMEVFLTNDRVLIGEIGCRPAGGLISGVVENQYGIKLWDYYMALNINETLEPIALNESDKYQGWLGLSCKEGKITRLTPSKDLLQIDEVKEVIDIYNEGDYVDPRWKGSTIFFSKLLFFELNNLEDLDKLRKKLLEVYNIEVSPYVGV